MPFTPAKIHWGNIANGYAAMDPDSRNLLFFVPQSTKVFGASADPYPYVGISVDPESGERGLFKYGVPMTQGINAQLDDGTQGLLLFDYFGNGPFVQGQGMADGPYANVKCIGTVYAGTKAPSSTSFDLFPLEPSDGIYSVSGTNSLIGTRFTVINPSSPKFLYRGTVLNASTKSLLSGSGYRIYTDKKLTDGSTHNQTVSTGCKIAFGSVLWKRRTGQFYLGKSPKDTGVLDYLYLYFNPARTSGNLYIQLYFDGSSTAFSGWQTRSEDGVTMVASQSRIVVDLDQTDGFVKVPLGSQSVKTFEIEFESLEPNIDLQLYRIEVEGRTEEERS